MLALRLIVGARVPTLVFDEVDAGVGGAAARSVGRALAALAEGKQVLVVTHLPQVAAFADAQVALTKHDDGATTVDAGRGPRRRAAGAGAGADAVGPRRQRHRARTTPRSSSPPPPRSGAAEWRCATDAPAPAPAAWSGAPRVGKRTKDLTKRLEPGDIAVIDHADLDRVAADGLIDAGRGRGRQRVAVDHRPLPERRAAAARARRRPAHRRRRQRRSWTRSTDGQPVRLDGGAVLAGDEELGAGHVLGEDEIERRMEEARAGIGTELQRFAENTLEYVAARGRARVRADRAPEAAHRRSPAATRSSWCAATTTSRTSGCCGPYIREFQPVLIGVDGGADALLEVGLTPDIILGDFDSVSARAMEVGAEHVHHVHPDGRNPGCEELQAFGKPYDEFVVEGTSEDAAMLLAYEAGAKLIVAVGTHDTMVEFLDKGRAGHVVDLPHPAADRARCSSTPRAWPGSTSPRSAVATSCSSCSPRCS